MFVYLLRKCVILFCCCLLALLAHVCKCVTGKEQTVLRLKNFWDVCWWWAYWRSRWLLNTGQRTLYTICRCLVQLWAEISYNYCCQCYTKNSGNSSCGNKLQTAPSVSTHRDTQRDAPPQFFVEMAMHLIPKLDENDTETFLISFEKTASLNFLEENIRQFYRHI